MAYVYRHIRLDKNVPFYVGMSLSKKKSNQYFRAHEIHPYTRNRHWQNIFNKTEIEVEIIMDNLTDEEAKEKEKEFIAIYKRIIDGGTLTNLTIGGDGVCGFKNPSMVRNRFDWTGKKHTKETKIKMSNSGKGLKKKYKDGMLEKVKANVSQRYSGVKNPRYLGIIYAYDKDGDFIGEFDTAKEICNILGRTGESALINYIRQEKRNADGILFTRRKLH